MIFFNKKKEHIESEEYKKLYDRISKLELKSDELESKIDFTKAEIKLMRKKRLKVDEEEKEDDNSKELNNPVILPYNGTFK